MKPAAALLLALLASTPAWAQWHFDKAVDVAGPVKAFHHLSASGRKSLAVSGQLVALTWEDDHTGTPRCYLALKGPNEPAFITRELGEGECYDPAVTALDSGRFAAIWEDTRGVSAARIDASGIGPALRLAESGGHGNLAWHSKSGLWAAWSPPEGRFRRIQLARIDLDTDKPRLIETQPADPSPAKDDQMYPVLINIASGLALAWEDRRHGHTVIYSSRLESDAWNVPFRISQNPTGKAQGTDLGRGTGAMRPSLAAYGDNNIAAVWLDKRDFLSGYDVYAALSTDGGKTYGKNQKAQDSFGDTYAQWHASAAGNRKGDLVIAWDDDRDGTSDIWLTWLTPNGFAENVSPAVAAGSGNQNDPVLALDEVGNLHLAWIERNAEGISRIRYAVESRSQ